MSAFPWLLVGAGAWLIIGFAVAVVLSHLFAGRDVARPTERPASGTDEPEAPPLARGA